DRGLHEPRGRRRREVDVALREEDGLEGLVDLPHDRLDAGAAVGDHRPRLRREDVGMDFGGTGKEETAEGRVRAPGNGLIQRIYPLADCDEDSGSSGAGARGLEANESQAVFYQVA